MHDQSDNHTPTLLRRPQVESRTGQGRSALYASIAAGLFPQPVKFVGSRSVGWPAGEVRTVVEATVAGATEAEMRELVRTLIDRRKAARGGSDA